MTDARLNGPGPEGARTPPRSGRNRDCFGPKLFKGDVKIFLRGNFLRKMKNLRPPLLAFLVLAALQFLAHADPCFRDTGRAPFPTSKIRLPFLLKIRLPPFSLWLPGPRTRGAIVFRERGQGAVLREKSPAAFGKLPLSPEFRNATLSACLVLAGSMTACDCSLGPWAY
jgi:hypothetical protein